MLSASKHQRLLIAFDFFFSFFLDTFSPLLSLCRFRRKQKFIFDHFLLSLSNHFVFFYSLPIFEQEEYRYDNDSNQQNLAESPSATGPGWAQRVKGWFSSVRQCVFGFLVNLKLALPPSTACLPCSTVPFFRFILSFHFVVVVFSFSFFHFVSHFTF